MTQSNVLERFPAVARVRDESPPAHSTGCPLFLRISLLTAIIVPFVGLIVGIVMLWGSGISQLDLVMLIVGYTVTAMSVGLGYHRLFTHRAFDTFPVIKWTLAVVASMAAQGPILNWVATHRRHHQHSDDEHDPHSPHKYGEGVGSMIRGYFHSHMGWFFTDDAFTIGHYVGDLKKDPAIRFISAMFGVWVALGLVIPAVIGGVVTGTWTGALLGFIWGGLVRILVCHHVTWSINSACHIWGSQTFRSDDHSRNNVLFGLLAFGEGWHNNHHAFPTSARHGLRWWQFDANYVVIRAMQKVGLAWNVRLPAPSAIAAKQELQFSQSCND